MTGIQQLDKLDDNELDRRRAHGCRRREPAGARPSVMSLRMLRAAAISSLLIAAACSSSGNSSSTPAIALHDNQNGCACVRRGDRPFKLRNCAPFDPRRSPTSSGRACFAWPSARRAPAMLGTYGVTDERSAIHASVRARSRPPVRRPIRSVASAGSGRRRRARDRCHCHCAGDARHAFNHGRARVSVG